MEQKFIIEGRLGNLNDCILANRKGRFCGNHFKHTQQDIVRHAIGESDLERVVEYPLHVTFIFYEKDKRRDLDNISGWAHKCVMDELVHAGILENDGWKQICGYTDLFFVDKDNPRIEVILKTVNQAENQI